VGCPNKEAARATEALAFPSLVVGRAGAAAALSVGVRVSALGAARRAAAAGRLGSFLPR